MQTNLTIDRGNTAIKAALWDLNGSLLRHTAHSNTCTAADIARTILQNDDIVVSVAYCSVVNECRDTDIQSLESICSQITELKASYPSLPIKICYSSPNTLGADRIAAAIGARCHTSDRAILVADFGTAVTYDFISADGNYIGGNIAPGIQLRLDALTKNTSALPSIDTTGNTPIWGNTTEEALRSGSLRGVAAELEYYRRAAGTNAVTILTGGSVEILEKANILNFDYINDPYLVHRGLNSILK